MKPTLKWVGGKHRLLNKITKFFPKQFNNYYEPFLGGGAIAAHIYTNSTANLMLSDTNENLMQFYTELIECDMTNRLLKLSHEFNALSLEEQSVKYYEYRKEYNKSRCPYLFYFLNKTSFNGMMRYNSKGEYNIPFGKRNFSVDTESIRKFRKMLQSDRITIERKDFREITPHKNDLIYLDPPYHPINETSNFTRYNIKEWGFEDEIELKQEMDKWAAMGCHVFMSNNDVPFIRELFSGYRFEVLKSKRCIGGKSESRKTINEVLIQI